MYVDLYINKAKNDKLENISDVEKTQALTIIPGDDAWMISGLNLATSEIILGLRARERGTFWYQGQGKL